MQTRAFGQTYLLGIWIFISVLTPLLGFLGARGFAPAIGVMGLLCLPMVKPRGADGIGFGLLAALVVWAGVSLGWSPAPQPHSLKDFQRLTVLHLALQLGLSGAFVVSAGRFAREDATKALRGLSYGLLALAAILVIEGLTQAKIYQALQHPIGQSVRPDLAVRNVAVGGYVLAALIWPIGVALYRNGQAWRVLPLCAAVIFSTIALRGDSPTLAILASGGVFVAVLLLGRVAVAGATALAAAYWLFTPWVMLALQKVGVFQRMNGHLPPSWNQRLDIWTFTTQRIREDPLFGWGLDASREFKGYIPLHPHDGSVQVWFELGLPGALLAAGFFVFLGWRVWRGPFDRLFAATAAASLTVYLVIGAISFSLWQEWWICLGAFALAACVVLRRSMDAPVSAG